MSDRPQIPFDEDGEARERRIGRAERAGKEHCLFCGRATDGSRWVHMVTDGTLFAVAEDHESDPDSQGWFSVGPECARKVPAAYVSRQVI